MKIIFLGTPEFAVPALRALIAHHEVVAVVTMPDKPSGRGKKIKPTPVEVEALAHSIPVHKFKKIRIDGVEALKSIDADVIITCAYGQILSAEILNMKKYGVLNIHGSVLPKYRGASPIQWTVINGDSTAGLSVLKSDVGMDDGPVLTTMEIDLSDYPNITSLELFDILSQLSPKIILQALASIEDGSVVYIQQNHEVATHCKKLTKAIANIDLSKSAKEVVHLINGINAWPVATLTLDDDPIKVYKSGVLTSERVVQLGILEPHNYLIGEVVVSNLKQGLVVRVGDGFIELLQLQKPGGKVLDYKSYLNGNKLKVGRIFSRVNKE